MDIHLAALKDPIIGQDFLTWLWFACEAREGRFSAPELGDFLVFVEQKVSVQGGDGENVETAQVSGPHSALSEARQGLKGGKRVNRAQVRFEQDGAAWTLTLKAEDLSPNLLRTPKIETKTEEGDDPDAPFLEKMYLLERAGALLDAVFGEFLKLRFSRAWTDELASFSRWLAR